MTTGEFTPEGTANKSCLKVFPLPRKGLLIGSKLPFSHAELFCMETAAGQRGFGAEIGMEHFMINDELHEVGRNSPSVQHGVDAYDIGCTTVTTEGDPAWSSAAAALPPGNACCYAVFKIFPVQAFKDVGQAVNSPVGLQSHAAGGMLFRKRAVFPDKTPYQRPAVFSAGNKPGNSSENLIPGMEEYPVKTHRDMPVLFCRREHAGGIVRYCQGKGFS